MVHRRAVEHVQVQHLQLSVTSALRTRGWHIQVSSEAFAAMLADASVVSWGNTEFGSDSSTVHEKLRDVQHIQATNSAFAAIQQIWKQTCLAASLESSGQCR